MPTGYVLDAMQTSLTWHMVHIGIRQPQRNLTRQLLPTMKTNKKARKTQNEKNDAILIAHRTQWVMKKGKV